MLPRFSTRTRICKILYTLTFTPNQLRQPLDAGSIIAIDSMGRCQSDPRRDLSFCFCFASLCTIKKKNPQASNRTRVDVLDLSKHTYIYLPPVPLPFATRADISRLQCWQHSRSSGLMPLALLLIIQHINI